MAVKQKLCSMCAVMIGMLFELKAAEGSIIYTVDFQDHLSTCPPTVVVRCHQVSIQYHREQDETCMMSSKQCLAAHMIPPTSF